MEEFSNFEQDIITIMEQDFKHSVPLPEAERLLLYLNSLFIITGQADAMFCNAFIEETITLLKNSIFLYKDGLFDCAFYSVRQANEVINGMFYLVQAPSQKKNWAAKGFFPMDNKIRQHLERLSIDYKEIKSLLPEYFTKQETLIKQTHKIIHKQGLDTFYRARRPYAKTYGFNPKEETTLFLEVLKYTIGMLLIIFILIDPLSLLLVDEKITYKLNIDPLTEPVDINYFRDFLGLNNIIEKIMNSNFYKNIVSSFDDYEEMNIWTYCVVRESHWDINNLVSIKKQIHLISPVEKIMLLILDKNIKVSNFYIGNGFCWYTTSTKCKRETYSFNSMEFEYYAQSKKKYNQPRDNVFISVIKDCFDEPIFIEHNELLSDKEIGFLEFIEKSYLSSEECYQKLFDMQKI